MKNSKLLIVLLSVLLCCSCSGGDFGEGKHTISGVVTNVGSCGGGEGFFSGNYECAVEVRSKGTTQYWNVYGQTIKGQTIYKHCWIEDGVT